MFTLLNPKIWLVYFVSLAIAYGSGYATCWWKWRAADRERESKQETAQAVTTKTITVTDNQVVNRLTAQLTEIRGQNRRLLELIDEYSVKVPAVDQCRLPDGLRNALNGSLAERP